MSWVFKKSFYIQLSSSAAYKQLKEPEPWITLDYLCFRTLMVKLLQCTKIRIRNISYNANVSLTVCILGGGNSLLTHLEMHNAPALLLNQLSRNEKHIIYYYICFGYKLPVWLILCLQHSSLNSWVVITESEGWGH